MILPHQFKQLSLVHQICVGIVCGLLNYLYSTLLVKYLFMDCIFTIAASFLGLWSGIIVAIVNHFIWFLLVQQKLHVVTFAICSFTIIAIIRISFAVLKRKKQLNYLVAFFFFSFNAYTYSYNYKH